MKRVAIVVAVGCSAPVHRPEPVAMQPELTIDGAKLGPITARSTATLQALRNLFGGEYAVAPVNGPNGLGYEVSRAGEHVLFVEPDEAGIVDKIRVVSARVNVAGRAWHVGQPFRDPAVLTACECDGDDDRGTEQTTCYKQGEHVAVTLTHGCDGLDEPRDRAVLSGLVIQRLVWRARPWGVDDADAFGGAGDGGD